MVRSQRPAQPPVDGDAEPDQPDPVAQEQADLSYNQARTALELVLAELQARDLDVEAMVQLYRQGQNYARACESILDRVEQEVLLWDAGSNADSVPEPYTTDRPAES
jgi:exodeoxyribonuclease VII small subunit